MKKLVVVMMAVFCIGIASTYARYQAAIYCNDVQIGEVRTRVTVDGFLYLENTSDRMVAVTVDLVNVDTDRVSRRGLTFRVPANATGRRAHEAGRQVTPPAGHQSANYVARVTAIRCL